MMSDASTHEPGSECRSCPVCLVLQALQEVRPEVRMHLFAAGRELVLALRAALAPDMASGEGERQRAGGWGSQGDDEPVNNKPTNNGPAQPSRGVPHDETSGGRHRRLRRIDIQ